MDNIYIYTYTTCVLGLNVSIDVEINSIHENKLKCFLEVHYNYSFYG